jgi:hypothetical protein
MGNDLTVPFVGVLRSLYLTSVDGKFVSMVSYRFCRTFNGVLYSEL